MLEMTRASTSTGIDRSISVGSVAHRVGVSFLSIRAQLLQPTAEEGVSNRLDSSIAIW